jgi:hypothetical protein
MILKNRSKIKSVALMANVLVVNEKLRGAGHSQLQSAHFQWFFQKRALGILIDGPLIKRKTSELAL